MVAFGHSEIPFCGNWWSSPLPPFCDLTQFGAKIQCGHEGENLPFCMWSWRLGVLYPGATIFCLLLFPECSLPQGPLCSRDCVCGGGHGNWREDKDECQVLDGDWPSSDSHHAVVTWRAPCWGVAWVQSTGGMVAGKGRTLRCNT